MKLPCFVRTLMTLVSGLCLTAMIAGCGKKAEPPAPAAPADAAPAAPAAAPAAAPTPAVRPATPSGLEKIFADTDAAIKAKEYELAVQTFLTGTRGLQLTEQQGQAAQGRMVQLQGELAGAAATGDPKARAAVELLRRYSMQR